MGLRPGLGMFEHVSASSSQEEGSEYRGFVGPHIWQLVERETPK